jgi:hypothetical protein
VDGSADDADELAVGDGRGVVERKMKRANDSPIMWLLTSPPRTLNSSGSMPSEMAVMSPSENTARTRAMAAGSWAAIRTQASP